MIICAPMRVWCEPIKRENPKLCSGDIVDALRWFKKKTGHEAKLAILNPKNERYAKEAGDTVKVEYLGGCLQWEVWLSDEDSSVTPRAETVELEISCNKKESIPIASIGRPTIDLPVEKIQDLASQGLSCRVIAERLKSMGVTVSHMAVHRAIRRLQTELPIAKT